MPAHLGLKPGAKLVVGVSGGPDSLALLHSLRESGFPLLVASFNHQLRPESAADVEHVRQIATAWGLPFITASGDVATHAKNAGLSIEEAARELRYRFLFRAAREAGAQAVAVGHTADDQAETVLMHFLRGAGLAGLKGMPPRVILPIFDAEIPLIRPILGWTRAQTEACCRENNIPCLTDSTNTDTAYLRNRLRHQLLPQLEAYNPQIRQTLARTAAALQGDDELLSELVDSIWGKTVRATDSGFVALDVAQLRGMSPALLRRLFRKAAFTLKPGLRDVDFEALERAATLQPVDLAGGLKTLIEADALYITEDESALPTDQPQIGQEMRVGAGQISLKNGWALSCESLDVSRFSPPADRFTAFFDADLAEDRLRVRSYRSGDRFEQLGMPRQTVKLADLYVNLKIPHRLRKNWPLVCVEDEIAWVPGLRMGEKFKVNEKSRRVVKVQLKRLP